MAVEEQISEVAAAPNSLTDSSLAGDDVAHKEQAAANGNASNGDAVGEEFGELDDLEAVDMSGGALMKHLPETEVNGHCDHHDGPLLCDTMPTLQPDMLPDLTERSSHLSASATPDKAREIDAITQRIAVLHEHLQKSNTHQGAEEVAGRIAVCRSVEDVSQVLMVVVKRGFDCHPTFSLWSNQDRTDWEKRCRNCSSIEIMAELVTELEQEIGVETPADDEATNCEIGGGVEGEEPIKADFSADEIAEETVVEEQAPASTSRFGRVRAVPNFARMVDPLAMRTSNSETPTPRAAPSNGGADDVQATATQNMIELVRVIVSKAPKPGAAIDCSAAAAGSSPAQPSSTGQDKYVGVRIKQNGFGAVIKKNHSEINLGTFSTPEEAARAYDMAALICQGDRAKVNFLDSWDIVQEYDTSAIREPFRDHHRESQREHLAASVAARHQHAMGGGIEVDMTPLTYESADTSKPWSLGRLLNQFSDRFPYAAVRDLDPAVWEVFTERNTTLSSFGEFGSQLLWLSAQVTDAAMRDSWGLHQHEFESGCKTCADGDKCVDLLKDFDEQGVDWDKVGSLWEIDDGEGGEMGKRGGMKRKRAGEAEGREKIEDFLQLNWHILSDYERDGTKGLQQGIEPTLGLMRSHRQPPKPVPEERPKKLTPPVQAVKTETVARRPVANNARPVVDRRAGRDREREKESCTASSSKNKGMSCRFCGKVFFHAPAHLQHERAHLQQQETKNPSSRIFQHMPTTPASKASVRTGRSAPLSPGSIEPKTQTVYTLKESLGTPRQLSKVKAEEDECLVDPPQQDSLEQLVEQMEPNSQLHEGEEEAADEDDDDKVAQPPIEDDGEDEEDGMQMDASNVEGGEVLEGGKVCGSKACVEQAIPCPPCAKHNKGIAACFAQGHLYMTIKGEVPSSCKDCKQRNKGALFCFKRGHMVKLRAMLGATSPKSVPLHAGTTLPALNSKEAEDVGGDKMDEGSDVGPDADAPNASDALDLDNHVNDDDMSGPVSPQDECSL